MNIARHGAATEDQIGKLERYRTNLRAGQIDPLGE
jgi:hypothetical protein